MFRQGEFGPFSKYKILANNTSNRVFFTFRMTGWQTGLLIVGITLFILIIGFCVFCQKDNCDVITPRPVAGVYYVFVLSLTLNKVRVKKTGKENEKQFTHLSEFKFIGSSDLKRIPYLWFFF